MAVQGNLSEISLTDLIQLNCQSGMTGRLTVSSRGRTAQVFFDGGVIVHVTQGEKSGQEVFYEILGWDSGVFTLESGILTPTQTINARCSDLLLGGLHQLDEKSNPKEPAPGQLPLPEDVGELFGFEKSNLPETEDLSTEDTMAQNMQEILMELTEEVPGLLAAAVVGMDGLPVADVARGPVNIEQISAQMTLLIKLVETSTEKLDAGTVQDYLLTTDKAYLLLHFLGNTQYFLGMSADRSKTNLGKMRLYNRVFAEKLIAAMPR